MLFVFFSNTVSTKSVTIIFDEDTILSVSQKSYRGSGLIRKIISFVGIRNTSKIFSTLSFLIATIAFIYIAFYMHIS